jgi:hypothetical protein
MNPIVVFSNVSETGNPAQLQVRDWSEVLALSCEPGGFWIAAGWDGDLDQLAGLIRASRWWDRLAFTAEPCPHPLLDGQLPLPDATLRSARAQLKQASLKVDPRVLIPAEKLLFYLYIRDNCELLPRYNQNDQGLYSYPLVQVLGAGEPDSKWFAQLTRSQLLSPVQLFDRIRACRQCGSGHLSYVDICPSCASLHIRHTPSLHCFTCGHVARQADFEVNGHLVCPKCEARLRHIGVDYDLPLAQYVCDTCHQASVEARIVASCFDCKHIDEPSQLDVKEIHSYSLNARGLQALRHGQFHASFGVSDYTNHIGPPHFRQVLLWSVSTRHRYQAMNFGVLLIEFMNAAELVVQLGAARVHRMLEEFTLRMRQDLRATDITSLDTAERLWVMLPHATPDVTEKRLLDKAAALRPSGGPGFAVRLKSYHASRDMLKGDDSDSIMARLLAN